MKNPSVNILVLLLLAALALSGCGQQNFGEDKKSGDNNSLSSTSSTLPSNEGKFLSACSRDGFSGNDIEFRMSPYREPSGVINGNMLRVQVSSLPAYYEVDKPDLRFYKWKADSAGNTNIPSAALEYRFEHKNSSGAWELISGQTKTYTRFNFTEVKGMGAYAGIDTTTANSFFKNVSILIYLNDPGFEFQALRLSLQKSDSTNRDQELSKEDGLMPPFWADPIHYRSTKPAVLSVLHPLNYLTSVLTQSEYEDKTRDFCF